MGRLTKDERKVLQHVWKHRETPPTRGSLMVDHLTVYAILLAFVAFMTLFVYLATDLLFIEVAVGVMIGILFRDFLYFGSTVRRFSIEQKITNWDLIERLLEKDNSVDEEADQENA